MKIDVTPVVLEIEQMDFSGHLIPASWYQGIKTDHGKTALLSINILADIVYWYKPTVHLDETSGLIVSKNKKFKADKLQKKYQHYADFFGVPKDTVTEAIDLLVKRGLINREFRTIHVNGSAMNNVMFLEPIPSEIAKITYRVNTPMGEKPDRLYPKNEESLPPKKGYTNTEITTKNTYTRKLPQTDLSIENQIAVNVPVVMPFVTSEIKKAVDKSFLFKVIWDQRRPPRGGFIPMDFLDMCRNEDVTVELIVKAANEWRMNKDFNWQNATLKAVYEKWPALVLAARVREQQEHSTQPVTVK